MLYMEIQKRIIEVREQSKYVIPRGQETVGVYSIQATSDRWKTSAQGTVMRS